MRLVFAGTPEFAAVPLRRLLDANWDIVAVYTQPDRPAGRGRKPRASPVKHLALASGIRVEQPKTLREPAAQARLRALDPDVMVVAAYGLILPPEVLQIPRLGCINIHASLLPRWRGAAPIQRAILAGDRETGVTIMQLDAGLDTGDMLHRVRCPIGAQDTSATLHDRLALLGADALVKTLDDATHGRLRPEKQPDDQASYAHRLSKDEASIDWSRPAVAIERQVRAFDPWPVAYGSLGGERLRIWAARLDDAPTGSPAAAGASAGTVLACAGDGIAVATGAGVLVLTRVQKAGGKVLSAREYLNAATLRPGARFDSAAAGAPGASET